MTAILSLCLLVAGLLTVVGARNQATNILGGALLVFVFLAFVPCLLCMLGGMFGQRAGGSVGAVAWPVLGLALLAVVGYTSWRRREARQRAAERWQRRHGKERRRALPPPPAEEDRE